MKIISHSASIIDSVSGTWMQTYCEDGVGLILQLPNKEQGSEALEELMHVLKKLYPRTLAEFRKKMESVIEKCIIDENNFSLGVLRIVDGEGFCFAKGTSVFLSRGRKTAILLEDSGVINGSLQNKDRIFLLNKEVINALSLQKLIKLLDAKLDIEATAEELLLEMHKYHSNMDILGLLIETKSRGEQMEARANHNFLGRLKRLNITDTISRIVFKIITALFNLLRIKRVWLIFGFITLSTILLNQFKSSELNSHQFSESFELSKHQYEEGKALIELNRLRARDVLSESKSSLEELRETLKKKQEEYKQVSKLLLNVEKALKKAHSAYRVKPDLFFDLSLVRDGLTASLMKEAGNKLFVFSPRQRLIAAVSAETKASKVVAGGKWLKNITQMAVSSKKQYVLASSGVTEVGKPEKVVIDSDEEWGEIKDMRYFRGNIYLLDKDGFIWKYVPIKEGFSDKRNFLKGDFRLQNPSSMAIDGAVWVIADGQLLKFISGRKDSYFIRGLEKPIGDGAQLVKTPELDNLYILDRQNSRIVVLSEAGVYQSQYSWQGLKEVDDFAVFENLGKIFLLKKDKIYTIQLQ